LFDDEVRRAMQALEIASEANRQGRRDQALDRLQTAMDAIQGAGVALDGVTPMEVPMLPDLEMWGFSNGGRG
jgi:uncharacterized protein (DUF2342 family)